MEDKRIIGLFFAPLFLHFFSYTSTIGGQQ